MKILKRVLVTVAVLLVVVLVVVVLFLGQLVKTAVERVGPQFAGVEMSLESARVYLLLGDIKLTGLVIGNPEGFKTPSAVELAQFVVDIDMGSLFTDTIVIKKIHIDGPQITYERGLKTSNLTQIQENLAPAEEKPKKEESEAPKEKSDKPAKKVVIDDFFLENGKVSVSIALAGGKKLTVPMAPMHLTDIGKDSDGASITDIVNEVYGAIMASVGNAVSASGDLAGDALKGAGGMATDAAKGAGGAAGDAAKGATKGLKKLGSGLFGGKK
jgi:uncharacterized protein involved in outer membrane biogenesis